MSSANRETSEASLYLRCFLGTLVQLIFYIGLVPLWICVGSFRYILIFISKFRPDFGKALTWRDVLLLDNYEKEHGGSIAVTINFDGDPDIQVFKDIFIEKALNAKLSSGHLKYPELQQYQYNWFGFLFWKNSPTFNIDNHVWEISYEDLNSKQRTLQGILEERVCKPYPPKQSPWELILVHGFRTENGENETLLFWRSHHSMTDGYSIFALLANSLAENSQRPLFAKLLSKFELPWYSIFDVVTFIRGIWDFQRNKIFNRKFKAKLNSKREGKIVVGLSHKLAKSLVKQVALQYGIPIPAVIMALVAERASKVLKTEDNEFIYSPFIIPLPDRPENFTNHATQCMMKFPLGRNVSILEKMTIIKEELYGFRTNPLIIVTRASAFLIGNLFPSMTTFLLSKSTYFPIAFTNIATPKLECNFDKQGSQEIRHISGSMTPYLSTADAVFVIYGYNDYIQVSCCANDKLLDSEKLQLLMSGISEEFENFLKM